MIRLKQDYRGILTNEQIIFAGEYPNETFSETLLTRLREKGLVEELVTEMVVSTTDVTPDEAPIEAPKQVDPPTRRNRKK